MKVLHVDTGREWRGGQTQLLHLLRARRGDSVVLPPEAAWREAAEALGNPVYTVAFQQGWNGTTALARVVDQVLPDLVAAHTSHAHGHAWLAGGAPLVVHRRSDFAPGVLSGPKYRAPIGYVAVSAAVRDVLVAAGVHGRRIAVVPDGVDPTPFDPSGPAWDRNGPVARIGAVGALVDHKGHDVLIEAVAGLRARGTDARLLIAGAGDRKRALIRLAEEQGVRMELLGAIADVPGFLRSLDVFAHPSREEGLGQAVIEAMLAGVPVVASTAGGIPEIVPPGAGLLVPPDDASALADALQSALADRPAALARAEAGRQHALRYGVAAMVSGTEAAWEAALRAPRG